MRISRRKHLKIIFFDIETTGLNTPEHSLTEIAGTVIDSNTYSIIDSFSTLVNPGRSIPWQAQQINGITDETVRNSPGVRNALYSFMTWVKKHNPDIVAGHNIKSFDLKFVERLCNKFSVENTLASLEVLDTYVYVKGMASKNPLPNYNFRTDKGNVSYKMEHLAKYFNLDTQTHRALDDVYQNIIVYKHLKELEEAVDYGF